MKIKQILFIIYIGILATGCNYNSSTMLRTKKDYKYDAFPQSPIVEYKIAANDILTFSLYSNNGFKLIDLTTITTGVKVATGDNNTYLVEHDGFVKLPILNRIKLSGLTLREAELLLEEKYSADYVKPFVLLEISNRRVIVFPGTEGGARVINLVNNNTTLFEALALAGGIAENGKAKKVKLIRGLPDAKKREVYLLDLSRIDGLTYGDIVLQANDIIYVQPKTNIPRDVIRDFSLVIGLVANLYFIYRISRGI